MTSAPETVRVGATIRALREAYGLKVTELARIANVNRSYLNAVELGIRQPSPKLCRSVADALGVPLAAITIAGYQAETEPVTP